MPCQLALCSVWINIQAVDSAHICIWYYTVHKTGRKLRVDDCSDTVQHNKPMCIIQHPFEESAIVKIDKFVTCMYDVCNETDSSFKVKMSKLFLKSHSFIAQLRRLSIITVCTSSLGTISYSGQY